MDKRLRKQIERQFNILHEQWIEAIKQTPGIGPKRYQAIVEKRAEIARCVVDGRRTDFPRQ